MPTIAGMRRRGYPPEALRDFASRVGVTKKEHIIQMSLLENCVRENLNVQSVRAMAVLNPLKVVLTNYPEGRTEMLAAVNHPDRPELVSGSFPSVVNCGSSRTISWRTPRRSSFACSQAVKSGCATATSSSASTCARMPDGRVTEVHCTYDPDTRSGLSGAERKVKGTIHWVSVAHAVPAEVRLYDRLFAVSRPDGQDADFKTFLNPESLRVEWTGPAGAVTCGSGARRSPAVRAPWYFVADSTDHRASKPVFNRVVSLRDSWAKLEAGDSQR